MNANRKITDLEARALFFREETERLISENGDLKRKIKAYEEREDMNQALKDAVYNKGTQRQVNFMAAVGGMNEEEKEIFQLIHEGKTDIYIQQELNLSRKAYARIEEAIRAKLLLAVFECINHYMDDYNNI